MLDPSEDETEEPSHVGRWRRQKGPDEFQAAVEEERINEYSPQRDAMLTAIPRACTLQGVVPLRQRRPGAFSAKRVEETNVNELSDDELEAEYQEAVALTTILKQRRTGKPQSSGDHKAEPDKLEQKLSCAQGRRLGHGKDGHHCLTKVKRVNWAGDSSKLVRELCTVSCVYGSCKPVNFKPSCGSSKSLLHNLGLEKFDVCCGYVFLRAEPWRLRCQ